MALRVVVGGLKAVSGFHPSHSQSLEEIRITAPSGLGSALDGMYWNRDKVRQWIAQGQTDAEIAVREHSLTA
jgi:hypothetical protein